MEATLLEALLKDASEGKRADGSFKKTTWENALKALRGAYPGTSFGQRQVKTKVDGLKDMYRELQRCFNTSGFGRDPVTNLPTAPSQVWQDYLAVSTAFLLF
jgi:hypothetical protein